MVASRVAPSVLLAFMIMSTSIEARGQTKAETVVAGLNVPLGIIVAGEAGTLGVSEAGAGGVGGIEQGKFEPGGGGFPLAAYGPADSFQACPAALAMGGKQKSAGDRRCVG